MRCAPFLFLLALVVHADELVLEGGRRLSCEVLDETASEISVRLSHGTMVIPRTKVLRVEREDLSRYLLREGERSLRAGETRSAVECFERELGRGGRVRARLVTALKAHAAGLIAEFRLDEARVAARRLAELEHAGARELAERIDAELERSATLHDAAERALERDQYRQALALLDAWRLRRPERDERARAALASAHVGAARDAERRGVLRQALDHYRMASAYGARKESRQALYLLQPIAVLEALKEGDAARAVRCLDRIETTYPDRAVPLFLQAVVHHVRGDVKEAVAAYADAARIAESSTTTLRGLDYERVRAYATGTLRAAIARPPQEGVATWRRLFLDPLENSDDSKRFTVYAATKEQARKIGALADTYYEAIARDLLGALPAAAKAEIVIHPTRQAYLAADPAPPGTPLAPVTADRSNTIGVCYSTLDVHGKPLVRIEIDGTTSRLVADTLPHELVHVVQRQGLGAFRKGHWLDEGLAMLYESKQGRAERDAFWRRVRASRYPLPELLTLRSTPPDRVVTFYVQAHAFTTFLRGLGDDQAWSRFLSAYGAGTFEQAIKDVYGVPSVTALERAWEDSLE